MSEDKKGVYGEGGVYQRGNKWRARAFFNGKQHEKVFKTEGDAIKWKRHFLSKKDQGQLAPNVNKIKYEKLEGLVLTAHELKRCKSGPRLNLCLKKLRPIFGGMRAMDISAERIEEYVNQRREQGASDSSIQKEIGTLRRGFNLAIEKKHLIEKPKFPTLKLSNVRTGFFEESEFRAVLAHLPEEIKPIATLGYYYGMRKGEILGLQWKNVDFDGGVIRLDVGTTKNKEGRILPFKGQLELQGVMEQQRKRHAEIEWRVGKSIPWVFTWGDGRPIKDFRSSWKKACQRAGCPGKYVHDFRRTAARNMVRAGIPEIVAQRLTGHKTRSMFDRYNIVNEADLAEAVKRLGANHPGAMNQTATTEDQGATRAGEGLETKTVADRSVVSDCNHGGAGGGS